MKHDHKAAIAEYLAKGGTINRLPMNNVRRESLIPQKIRSQAILENLLERAFAIE